jgi:hypothetical protein
MQTATIDFAQKVPARIAKARSSAPLIQPELTPADPTKYPPGIFGKLPAGFILQEQHVSVLVYWHRKAMQAVANLPAGHTDDDMSDAMAIANEVFEAIKGLKGTSAGVVSAQMSAVIERLKFMGNDSSIEEELSVADFTNLAEALAASTAMPTVTKRVGPLMRGSKLTRAGLLHRYHAFLIGELQTLSLNLYGPRDYAMKMHPIDDAVTVRVNAGFKNGKLARRTRTHYPFFDESKLPARARSVLKSLKIDTEKSAER